VLFPGARVTTAIFLVFFYQLIEIPAIFVLGFWFVLQLFDGLGSLGAMGQATTGGVAFFAHIGGFIFGAVIAFVVRALGGGGGVRRTGRTVG
jgi:membrane associated rhomboid family serine protease